MAHTKTADCVACVLTITFHQDMPTHTLSCRRECPSGTCWEYLQRGSLVWQGCAKLILPRANVEVMEGRFGLLSCRAHAANGHCTCTSSIWRQPDLVTVYLGLWQLPEGSL